MASRESKWEIYGEIFFEVRIFSGDVLGCTESVGSKQKGRVLKSEGFEILKAIDG
jgi:hypothetical protein